MTATLSETELAALVAGFADRSLPLARWTHRAHVTVAAWHLERGPIDAAACLMRSGIIVYNQLVGPGNTAEGGYHETLTLFWLGAVDHERAAQDPAAPLVTRIAALLDGPLGRPDLPRDYYSPGRLSSQAARARWQAPDLAPLPWTWPAG